MSEPRRSERIREVAEKTAVSKANTARPTSEKTAAPAKKTTAPARRTVATAKQTTVPAKRTVATAKKTAATAKKTATTAKRTAVSANRTAATAKKTAAPARRTTATAKRIAASANRTVAPAKKAAATVKKTAAKVKKTAPGKQTAPSSSSSEQDTSSSSSNEQDTSSSSSSEEAASSGGRAALFSKQAALLSKQAASLSKQAALLSKQIAELGEHVADPADGKHEASSAPQHDPQGRHIPQGTLSNQQPGALKRARQDDDNDMERGLPDGTELLEGDGGAAALENSSTAPDTHPRGQREKRSPNPRRLLVEEAMREERNLPPVKRQKVIRWRSIDNFGISYKMHDNLVLGVWKQLERHIGMFIRHSFHSDFPWDTLTETDREWVASWSSPDTVDYVKLGKGIGSCSDDLWAAFIWRFLWDELWSPGCPIDKWVEGPWRSYGETQAAAAGIAEQADADEEVEQWCRVGRYATGRALYSLHGWHSDPLRIAARLGERLQCYRVPIEEEEDPEGEVEDILRQIGNLAVQADFYLQTSMYDVRVDFRLPEMDGSQKWGFPFKADCEYMEPYHKTRQGSKGWNGFPVLFMCKPLLRVFGDSFDLSNPKNTDDRLGHTGGAFAFTHVMWPVGRYEQRVVREPMTVVVDPRNSAPGGNGLQEGFYTRRERKTARPINSLPEGSRADGGAQRTDGTK